MWIRKALTLFTHPKYLHDPVRGVWSGGHVGTEGTVAAGVASLTHATALTDEAGVVAAVACRPTKGTQVPLQLAPQALQWLHIPTQGALVEGQRTAIPRVPFPIPHRGATGVQTGQEPLPAHVLTASGFLQQAAGSQDGR